MAIKRCPKCGSTQFKAEIIYGGIVDSTDNGFEITHKGEKCIIRPIQCGCGETFANGEKDLVEAKQCTQCGRFSDDIDENGKCEVCRLLEINPEYANMSTQELLSCIFKQQQELARQKAQDKIHAPADAGNVTQQPFPPVGGIKPEPASAEQKDEPASELSETAKEKLAGAQEAVAAAKTETKKGKSKRKKKAAEDKNEEQPAQASETTDSTATSEEQQPEKEEGSNMDVPIDNNNPSIHMPDVNPPIPDQQQPVQQGQNSQGDFETWMTGGNAAADPFSNGPDMSTSFDGPISTGNGELDAMFGTEADDGQAF